MDTYKETICLYILKKYYAIYTAKKRKYTDYEKNFLNGILNSKFIYY